MHQSTLSLFFLALTSTLISCGMPLKLGKKDMVHRKGVTTKMYATTDDSFAPIVKKFEALGQKELNDPQFKVGDIPINFGDTTQPEFDGVCFVYADDTKEIIVRKSWWDNAHPIQKEVLVFHELGHCRLGRTHEEDTVETGDQSVKTSVMHPIIPDTATYTEHQDGYIKELFTYSKSTLLTLLGIASL